MGAEGRVKLNVPVTIELVINFITIFSIDTVQQSFSAEIVVRGRSVGLAAVAGKVSTDTWEPRIRILNMIDTKRWNYRARLTEDHEMDLKWSISGVFSETFELHH